MNYVKISPVITKQGLLALFDRYNPNLAVWGTMTDRETAFVCEQLAECGKTGFFSQFNNMKRIAEIVQERISKAYGPIIKFSGGR
jgi:hypothetical protein